VSRRRPHPASAGDRRAAAGAHLRASNYYRMAAFYAAHTDPRHYKLWRASRDQFLEMTKLSARGIEYVEIDYEGSRLPAYFALANPSASRTSHILEFRRPGPRP
jgi:hypothetical protein